MNWFDKIFGREKEGSSGGTTFNFTRNGYVATDHNTGEKTVVSYDTHPGAVLKASDQPEADNAPVETCSNSTFDVLDRFGSYVEMDGPYLILVNPGTLWIFLHKVCSNYNDAKLELREMMKTKTFIEHDGSICSFKHAWIVKTCI